MLEFKSSIFIIIKNIIYGAFGGAAIAVIAYFFLPSQVAVTAGIITVLFLVYNAVYNDRLRAVIYGDIFSVYRGRKLKHQFTLSQVNLSARIKTVDTDSDCTLTVEYSDGEKTYIDFSLLGASRFYKLLDALGITEAEPVKVRYKR